MYKKIKNENGAIMVFVLFLIAILSIIIFTFSNQIANRIKSTINTVEETQVKYLADAGIEQSISDANDIIIDKLQEIESKYENIELKNDLKINRTFSRNKPNYKKNALDILEEVKNELNKVSEKLGNSNIISDLEDVIKNVKEYNGQVENSDGEIEEVKKINSHAKREIVALAGDGKLDKEIAKTIISKLDAAIENIYMYNHLYHTEDKVEIDNITGLPNKEEFRENIQLDLFNQQIKNLYNKLDASLSSLKGYENYTIYNNLLDIHVNVVDRLKSYSEYYVAGSIGFKEFAHELDVALSKMDTLKDNIYKIIIDNNIDLDDGQNKDLADIMKAFEELYYGNIIEAKCRLGLIGDVDSGGTPEDTEVEIPLYDVRKKDNNYDVNYKDSLLNLSKVGDVPVEINFIYNEDKKIITSVDIKDVEILATGLAKEDKIKHTVKAVVKFSVVLTEPSDIKVNYEIKSYEKIK